MIVAGEMVVAENGSRWRMVVAGERLLPGGIGTSALAGLARFSLVRLQKLFLPHLPCQSTTPLTAGTLVNLSKVLVICP
jgi:hypothetical protein